jgi:phosphoribosylformylglycinamidine (FGAM) synthase PurS component
LDFYRARNETGLSMLEHVEAVSSQLIVSFQLEAEFKKNRQSAILDGMQELKVSAVSKLGIFSDVKAAELIAKSIKEAEKQTKKLKARLTKALANPGVHDPVFKCTQRLFHVAGPLNLTRNDKARHLIRRKAFRRFLHGCPPRKKNDTTIGDALNWEWMIACAAREKADLVIVSRDSDYGVLFENRAYVNDHLKQEFSERVSNRNRIMLFTRLSEALKLFEIKVTDQEREAEENLIVESVEAVERLEPSQPTVPNSLANLLKMLEPFAKQYRMESLERARAAAEKLA